MHYNKASVSFEPSFFLYLSVGSLSQHPDKENLSALKWQKCSKNSEMSPLARSSFPWEKIDSAIIQEYLMCDRNPEEVKNTY